MTLLEIVSAQADDEGLWFVAVTASEAYLQQELRRLHAAIETAGGLWCHVHDMPMLFADQDMCDRGLTQADFDEVVTCKHQDTG